MFTRAIVLQLLFSFLLLNCQGQLSNKNNANNKVIITANLNGLDFKAVPTHIVNEFFELKHVNFSNHKYDSITGNFEGVLIVDRPQLMKFFLKDVFVTPGDSIHLKYIVLQTAPEYIDTLITTGNNPANYKYYKFFKSKAKKYENDFPKYILPFTKKSFEKYSNAVNIYYDNVQEKIVESLNNEVATSVYQQFILAEIRRHELVILLAELLKQDRRWLDINKKNKLKNYLLSSIDTNSTQFYNALTIFHNLVSNNDKLTYNLKEFKNLENDALSYPPLLKDYLLTTDIIEFARNKRSNDTALIMALQKAARWITVLRYQNKISEYGLNNLTQYEKISQALDTIKLVNANGKIFNLGNVISKNNTNIKYVNFWASWCGPCKYETKYFRQLQNKFSSIPVKFIQISIDTDKNKWKNASKKENMKFAEQYCLVNEEDYKKINNEISVPYYLIIDKIGSISVKNAPPPSKFKELSGLIFKL
jgi:thiol-disulfide isomerase/thioredoxin